MKNLCTGIARFPTIISKSECTSSSNILKFFKNKHSSKIILYVCKNYVNRQPFTTRQLHDLLALCMFMHHLQNIKIMCKFHTFQCLFAFVWQVSTLDGIVLSHFYQEMLDYETFPLALPFSDFCPLQK